MTTTHTYATIEVSAAAYEEIAEKMRNGGPPYMSAFRFEKGDSDGAEVDSRIVIDMHGIALAKEETR